MGYITGIRNMRGAECNSDHLNNWERKRKEEKKLLEYNRAKDKGTVESQENSNTKSK